MFQNANPIIILPLKYLARQLIIITVCLPKLASPEFYCTENRTAAVCDVCWCLNACCRIQGVSLTKKHLIFCFWPVSQLSLQWHSQRRQLWQRGRRRPYSVTSQLSIQRNWPLHGTSKMALKLSMPVWATSPVSALKWLFIIQMEPTVFAVASHCTPLQWRVEIYTSSARWSTRPTVGHTTDLLH